MTNIKNSCKKRKCIEKGLSSFERNNYFCGKLMVERDFWAEQLYHIGKKRLHNTYLHGWGTVCCLKVDPHPFCPNLRVIVRPGLAIDCWGREILLTQDFEVELESYKKNGNTSNSKPENLYICLSYKECETESVPVFLDDCGCREQCEPNRIREEFEIDVLTEDDFEEGELDEYLHNKIVSGKKVITGPGIVDLTKGWEQFDSGKVDGRITIKTSEKSYTSGEINVYNNVQKLMKEINDEAKNQTRIKIKYEGTVDRFTLEHDEKDEVIILEQTGKNPFFFEIKMAAYHTEYHKILNPCPEFSNNPRIILATIEGYGQINGTHLDSTYENFKTAAYTINNFQYRKVVPQIEFIDRVMHYMVKKGL